MTNKENIEILQKQLDLSNENYNILNQKYIALRKYNTMKCQEVADLNKKLSEANKLEQVNKWFNEFINLYSINLSLSPEYSDNPIIEYCKQIQDCRWCDEKENEILTLELKDKIDNLIAFINGDWVESNKICKLLNLDFFECMQRFDFSRKSEWWSLVGKTEAERKRNGQKVTCQFRLKQSNTYKCKKG